MSYFISVQEKQQGWCGQTSPKVAEGLRAGKGDEAQVMYVSWERVPNNCVFLTWKNLPNEWFKSPLETQLNISASEVILFYIFLVNILFCSHGFIKWERVLYFLHLSYCLYKLSQLLMFNTLTLWGGKVLLKKFHHVFSHEIQLFSPRNFQLTSLSST